MSSNQQRVKLNDGHFIPALGFGTYKPEEVRTMVLVEGSGENSLREDGGDKAVKSLTPMGLCGTHRVLFP